MNEQPKNYFNNVSIDEKSFALRDLLGIDLWDSFTVSTNVSTVGAPLFVGRYRFVGRECQFQAQLSAGTSIATTTGIHFFNLPVAAKGLAGEAVMTNTSTNVGSACAVNVSTGRVYLPTQTPTAGVLAVAGRYEIG